MRWKFLITREGYGMVMLDNHVVVAASNPIEAWETVLIAAAGQDMPGLSPIRHL